MIFDAIGEIETKLQALLAYDSSSPLIFSSVLFLFLFAGFMLLYSVFRRATTARVLYVILFSLYFYYKSSGIYFLLLVFAAMSDFIIARGIYTARHGVALALHKLGMTLVPGAKSSGPEMKPWVRVLGIFFTFNIVCVGWLLFRAESMQTVTLMLHQIYNNFSFSMIPQVISGYGGVFALLTVGYVLHMLPHRIDALTQRMVIHAPFILQIVMTAAVIWCVMQIKSSDIQPFIYFQF